MQYRVRYEIDLDAESPLEAAILAEEIMQRDVRHYNPSFTVFDEHGTANYIDLEDQLMGEE